ncbi:hypothetical protein O181_126057, partial [Austropuccinia psidii MF-1]|nr:hypothetical protein [Austropuccinia psidii MF-1]
LCNCRLDYAIANKLPKRYCKLIEEIGAHSDDEIGGKNGDVYAIRTLCYRSRKANIFFCKLDEAMASSEANQGAVSRRRTRVLPRVPIPSKNIAAPKGLPMDFYKLKWYKALNPMEKRTYPDQKNVAFLPNAEELLQAKRHPNKKCSDKQFNELYRDEVLKVFEISDEENFAVEGEEDKENNDSIDLEAPSEGDDDEEEGFFVPGEYQYEDDEYSSGEESSKEDNESEADVSSVGNAQSYSMEVVED